MIEEYKNEVRSQRKDSSTDESNSSSNNFHITKIVSLHLSLLQQFVGISAVSTYAG